MERCWLTPPVQRKPGVRQATVIGHRTMFSSRESCIEHRDAVVDVLQDAFGTGEPWHVTPTLDAAEVRIPESDLDAATAAFEDEGMRVSEEGPDGDWFELKVKP